MSKYQLTKAQFVKELALRIKAGEVFIFTPKNGRSTYIDTPEDWHIVNKNGAHIQINHKGSIK